VLDLPDGAFSTWCRCLAIDIPGYGRSPTAGDGLTMADMAQACWEAIDEACPGEPAILVGCSVGASLTFHMHHVRPASTRAIIVCGTSWNPAKDFSRRIEEYKSRGVDYRWDYAFQDMSAAFRSTQLAHYFVDMFVERNSFADAATIIRQFEALGQPDADDHHAKIACPTLILSGSEDNSHVRAFALKERISSCEMRVIPGAGHACQLEQPWLVDRFMIEFLKKHGLFAA
jgi:pimeloyl-ACP methyl ester carboxylesterase